MTRIETTRNDVLPGTVVTVYVESPRHGKDKGGGNG